MGAQKLESQGLQVLKPGSRLGRYRLGARLGSGGAASVYLAHLEGPHRFQRLLALKVVHPHLVEDPRFVDMFVDEASLAVRLAHPSIVHAYELERVGSQLLLAMEYLHGQPLSEICIRAAQRGRPLPWELIAWVGVKVAEALGYAHTLKGDSGESLCVVHRDVSPQNVFVTYDGQVKLIDFGVARALGRISQTGHGRLKGKFRYMAPEQVTQRDFDHRVDLFALGATLYETLAGESLLTGDDEVEVLNQLIFGEAPELGSLLPDLPPHVASVLSKALARDAEQRFQSGEALARELRAALGDLDSEDAAQRWSALLHELFPEEIAQRAADIHQLKQDEPLDFESLVPPAISPGLDSTLHATDPAALAAEDRATLVPAPVRGRILRGLSFGLPVGLVLLALALVFASRRAPLEPGAETQAVPPRSKVVLDLSVQPAVAAEIHVGDTLLTERPARIELERSSTPVVVRVLAEGFRAAELDVTPDRDLFLVVPLVAKPSGGEAPEPSGDVGASAAQPSAGKAHDRARPPQPQAPHKVTEPRVSDPLVTDNPF